MTASILVQLSLWPDGLDGLNDLLPSTHSIESRTAHTLPWAPSLHDHWLCQDRLPPSVTSCTTAMRLLQVLGPLHWERLPRRDLKPSHRFPPIPYAALIAAELIRLNEALPDLKRLRQFLNEHPSLISLLGFPGLVDPIHSASFNTHPQLPTQRHLARMLRMMPNAIPQMLLADSVDLIVQALRARGTRGIPPNTIGECISLDTKHILAWVKENNPKAYVAESGPLRGHRFDKNKQPKSGPGSR